ncbi:MAG TPA: hypothetical protein VLC09_10370 [Polyangiaceae bacterium]|nr:hypothetical protein [Polyangiaceae bacterium]
MRISLLLAAAVGASFIGSNCGGSGVGDPCVPEDEYTTSFSGFSVGEVNVESRSFQCLTRVCLVNHFQGRVSCPYGQDEATVATCQGDAGCADPNNVLQQTSCRVPDRDGEDPADRIAVPVDPQFAERTADDAVYCSCRCAGPDEGARYCSCPSGFQCVELVDDLGLGKGQLAGSYCIKDETEYTEANPPSTRCESGLANCGSAIDVDGTLRGVNPPNPAILTDAEIAARD